MGVGETGVTGSEAGESDHCLFNRRISLINRDPCVSVLDVSYVYGQNVLLLRYTRH